MFVEDEKLKNEANLVILILVGLLYYSFWKNTGLDIPQVRLHFLLQHLVYLKIEQSKTNNTNLIINQR